MEDGKKVIEEKLLPNNVYLLETSNFKEIKDFCIENQVDLVIPSSENLLCDGIVDYLRNELPVPNSIFGRDIVIFGPTETQSAIEGNKYYSKCLMECLGIPTSPFSFYTDKSFSDSRPADKCVIKYAGLAKGKGVFLPKNEIDKNNIVNTLYDVFSDDWRGLIIEDRLYGTEVSVLAFCNGEKAFLMPQAQDYKNVYDNNEGPNTGGMGAVCPVNILTDRELLEVNSYMNKVVQHLNYKGVLYAGLMKTNEGVFFLEFNCRFGDPETQVILNLLDCNLIDILYQCMEGKEVVLKWKEQFSATVVLSHIDYPVSKLDSPVEVKINSLPSYIKIYESGIINKDNKKYTHGGRVLSMVSNADSLQRTIQNIYNNTHKITYDGLYYRRDIGSNVSNDGVLPSVGILASGYGTCLETLLEKTTCVKIIITNNEDAGIIEKSRKYKIPYFYLKSSVSKNEYYEKVVNILRLFDIKLVILAGFTKIVPSILFDEFHTVNIHPSLLPRHKGLLDIEVHKSVIKSGDLFSGCTLHEVTNNVDGGWILLQKQLRVSTNNQYTLKSEIQKLEKMCIYEFVSNYKTKTKYEVDVDEGNAFIEILKQENPFIGGFCAIYKLDNGTILGAAADGVGTKLDLAIKHDILDTIGIDLVAMNVNDLMAGGFVPSFFMDYIAIDKMDKKKCYQIIEGIKKGCSLAKCSLIGGETAEMKGIYLKNKFDLAGFAVGTQQIFLPKYSRINENCYLYGIPSSGIHSNGFTLVNELLKKTLSPPDINTLLKPTRIYSELIDYYKEYRSNIFGVAHITGGGFHDNLIRILPEHISFELNNWEFPEIFKWIQKESNFSREEMLKTFNCGYGMVIITDVEVSFGEKIGRLKYNTDS